MKFSLEEFHLYHSGNSETLRKKFNNRFVSADEAVKAVKSGDRVYLHSNIAYPKVLVDALVKRKDELFDVEICHLMVLGDAPI